jgi:Flp pilus assembly protein TadB
MSPTLADVSTVASYRLKRAENRDSRLGQCSANRPRRRGQFGAATAAAGVVIALGGIATGVSGVWIVVVAFAVVGLAMFVIDANVHRRT